LAAQAIALAGVSAQSIAMSEIVVSSVRINRFMRVSL